MCTCRTMHWRMRTVGEASRSGPLRLGRSRAVRARRVITDPTEASPRSRGAHPAQFPSNSTPHTSLLLSTLSLSLLSMVRAPPCPRSVIGANHARPPHPSPPSPPHTPPPLPAPSHTLRLVCSNSRSPPCASSAHTRARRTPSARSCRHPPLSRAQATSAPLLPMEAPAPLPTSDAHVGATVKVRALRGSEHAHTQRLRSFAALGLTHGQSHTPLPPAPPPAGGVALSWHRVHVQPPRARERHVRRLHCAVRVGHKACRVLARRNGHVWPRRNHVHLLQRPAPTASPAAVRVYQVCGPDPRRRASTPCPPLCAAWCACQHRSGAVRGWGAH